MSMSEFCLELDLDSSQSHDISSIIFSDLYLLCSLIFSHPLYLSYFVFFSPYLFKLFSFLSPLFLTTSLLLLALLTVSPGLLHDSDKHHNVEGFHEFQQSEFEELEVYKIVFEGFTFEVGEEDPDGDLEVEEEPIDKCVIEGGSGSPSSNPESSSDEALWPEIDREVEEEFLKEKDGKVEDLSWEMEEIKPISIESSEVAQQEAKVSTDHDESQGMGHLHQEEFRKEKDGKVENLSLVKEEIEPMSIESNKVAEQEAKQSTDLDEPEDMDLYKTPKALSSYPSFGSYGSMRQEKEWKRTLACKLFEERHNAGGGAEGMDMLWETYEAEPKKNPKKGSYGVDDNDEEEDEVGVQLCCLQALKFSTGKMSLGMGRPSLVRFSKAVKGMRWLQHHVSKASKKGTSH